MRKAMRAEPVIKFLNSVSELRMEAARLRYNAASLERRLEALEQAGDLSPQTSLERASLLSRLSTARRLCAEKRLEAEQREAEVLMLIEALPFASWRAVLRLRYCDGLRWCGGKDGHPCVLSGMAEAGLYYSERQMYRLHLSALEAAAQLFSTSPGQSSSFPFSA